MSLCHLGGRGEKTLVKIARRASKTAIHELGHSYGLVHCRDHKCVMFFSFNLSDTDYKESRFCKKCWQELSLLKSGAYDRKEV
jgi:archaemetzincin